MAVSPPPPSWPARWRLHDLHPHPASATLWHARQHGDPTRLLLKQLPAGLERRGALAWYRVHRHSPEVLPLRDSDPERGLLLLPEVDATPLWSQPLAAQQTAAVAALLHALWARPCAHDPGLIAMTRWTQAYERYDPACDQSPLSRPLWERALRLRTELLSDVSAHPARQRPLHGDLHHGNVLATPTGLRLIDPKGLWGPPEAELEPWLRNPTPRLQPLGPAALRRLVERRLHLLCDTLGLDRQRVAAWSLVMGVLSALWSLESGGDPSLSLRVAQLW